MEKYDNQYHIVRNISSRYEYIVLVDTGEHDSEELRTTMVVMNHNLAQRFWRGDLPYLAELTEDGPVGLSGLFGEEVLQPQDFVVDELVGW